MNSELLKVFNLISYVKNINEKLYITKENNRLFTDSYLKNGMYKRVTMKKWKNCIINYSIEHCVSYEDSIKFFVEYKNNNKG